MMYISFGEDVRVCFPGLCWFPNFDTGSSERRVPSTSGPTMVRSPSHCHCSVSYILFNATRSPSMTLLRDLNV